MKNENYILIQGWMINQLKLKGNELLVYAIIYGFSQDGETVFKGSSRYISEALQVSRTTAVKTLDSLVKKGLIEKSQETINDVQFNRYTVSLHHIQKLYGGYTETVQGLYRNCTGGYTETVQGGYTETVHSNNNISNTKEYNNKVKYKGEIKANLYFPQDEKLNNAFIDFLDMRKKKRVPNTDRAISIAINKLNELSKDFDGNIDNEKAIKILEQSTLGGWSSLYPLKENNIKSGAIDWDSI